MKTIFYKFGLSIIELNWESCKLTKAEVITLLNFLPNLKSLSAISWKLRSELYDEPTNMLNLPNLVKLKIAKSDFATVDFFTNSLPTNVITDLIVQGEPEELLAKQQSVTRLELSVDAFNHSDLNNMQLSHLKLKLRRYKSDESSIIQQIVERQPILTFLDLMSCEGCFDEDDAAFIAVSNLASLESLKLNIDELSSATFLEHFSKLKNLKSLELESVEHNFTPIVIILDEFSRQEMDHLEHLRMYLNDVGIPLDRIERMGKNFRNLKSFTIRCDHPLPLDCYLVNMNNLQSLHIDYHYSKEFAKLCFDFDIKCYNLQNLSLHGFGFGSDDVNWNELSLLKLADIAPNLVILEIDAAFPFNTDFIFKIMEKLNDLRVLKNWIMSQSGDNYIKFDQQSILDLRGIAGMLEKFSIELRLKVIDMDVSRIKHDLSKEFNVAITRVGNFFVIKMEKK